MRTAALWGLRLRSRFMHDLASFTFEDAIDRHRNQAASSRDAFHRLRSSDKRRVLTFLSSL
jgi:CxxC motif-containing protein (DUF1111 family)